ncbi:hypothetical protein GH714_026355 [Hevea brasiliensis]|uniref:Uncharacterized protein n=1 Tax=Hevea brasiliensis TaxID=3981 RepID=A0A6A6MH51_HEVBR|nr:hypothetical protein GH714_026355 [Hevea brasiliensis]
MSRIRSIEILDPYCRSLYVREASIFTPKTLAFPSFIVEEETDDLSFALDLLKPDPCELFDSVSDLVQIEKPLSFYSYKRIQKRVGTELCFQTLCDRVSALESRFERLINANVRGGDRKYTWTTEIKGPVERKSKVLRALRELAIAKSKLKEIRSLFNNFSYRRQVARDAVERQRFSEKSLSCFSLWMLLRSDGLGLGEFLRLKFHTLLKGYKLGRFIVDLNWKGTDLMVRAAKRSMVDELEAMLDVVDPQPPGKLNSMKRRIFDMPDGVIRKEIAEGVAQVVQMLDNEENLTSTFEACL